VCYARAARAPRALRSDAGWPTGDRTELASRRTAFRRRRWGCAKSAVPVTTEWMSRSAGSRSRGSTARAR
jgi:hypothetical protein